MQISHMLKNIFAPGAKETKIPSAVPARDRQPGSVEAEIIHLGQAALRHCPDLLYCHHR